MGPEHWVAVRLRPSCRSMSGHYPPPPASPYAFTLDNRLYREDPTDRLFPARKRALDEQTLASRSR